MNWRPTLVLVLLAGAAAALLPALSQATAPGKNGRLAYVTSNNVGDPQIWISNPGLSSAKKLPDGKFQSYNPVWSPQGTRLAFFRGRGGGMTKPSHFSVYVAAASGRHATRLAACGGCGLGELAWSPNGKWIAFTREVAHVASLWVVSTVDGRARHLDVCAVSCGDSHPSWSPDGKRIVFAHTESAAGSIDTVRLDGTGLRRIAKGWGDPEWSPTGDQIVFDDGPEAISVVDANGSNLHMLLARPRGTGPGAPSWSPDGRKLVFFMTPGQPGHYRAEVWTMNPDGSGRERLYHSPCCVKSWTPPVWSPDGRMVAFSADSAGGTFVIYADGSGLRRLTKITTSDLSWQPLPVRSTG